MNKETTMDNARITIDGEGVDEWGKRYFKLSVQGSAQDIPPFSADQIIDDPKQLLKDLANAGANTFAPTVKTELLNQIQGWEQQSPTFKVATRLGCHGSCFVFPDGIVGTPKTPLELVLRDLDPQMQSKYRCKGTLQDWQEKIGALCEGNSRLMFAASLACTGPILRFVTGPRSGGFQISGLAETGKPLALWLLARSGVAIVRLSTGKGALLRPGTRRQEKLSLPPWLTTRPC
jgi:putative DNA primase/helicase